MNLLPLKRPRLVVPAGRYPYIVGSDGFPSDAYFRPKLTKHFIVPEDILILKSPDELVTKAQRIFGVDSANLSPRPNFLAFYIDGKADNTKPKIIPNRRILNY